MIDYEDQGAENYLTPEELRYPVEEQQVLIALRYLADNDDSCADKDHAGFSRIDGEFGRDLARKEYPLTAKQLLAAHKICKKYMRTQLSPAGIILPEDEAVQAVARRKEMQWTARQQQREAPASYDTGSKARVIGIKDGMLGVMFPPQASDFQSNLSKIKAIQQEVEGLRLLNPTMPRVCFVDDKRDGKVFKYWQCPLEMLERVAKTFPDFKMTPDVQRFIDAEAERKADEQRKIEEAQRAHRERVERLLAALGDLDAPIGDRTLYAHQREAVRTMLEWGSGIIAFEMGTGKAQPLTAKVLTPQGWRLMGDIQVGDEVINSQGTVSHVTGVYPQGEKEIYKVTFSDGSSTECCDEHLWSVNTPTRIWRGMPARVLSLKQIANDLCINNGNAKHYIPIVKPVQFPNQDLPLDPYLLGVLLGDGGISRLTIKISSADQELLDSASSLLPTGVQLYQCAPTKTSRYDWRISTGAKGGAQRFNPVLDALRKLGLQGHLSYTKFIPESYKFSSIEQRIALLQGLLDTDGSIDKRTGAIEFHSSSKQLALDVIEIVQSLGGRATFRSKAPQYTYNGEKRNGSTAYSAGICLSPGIVPFRLSRKANIYRPREKYQASRAIRSVEYVGVKQAQCIAVDAPDHLYITDNYIVTHNTSIGSIIGLAYKKSAGCRVIIIGPKTMRSAWVEEAGRIECPIEYYTHDSCPTDIPGKFVLIVDEADYFQNMRAARTKKFMELAWKAEAVFPMTGTPARNGRPSGIYPLLLAVKNPAVYAELSDGTPAHDEIKKLRKRYEARYCAATATEYSAWDTTGAAYLEEYYKKFVGTPRGILRKLKKDCLDLPEKVRKLVQVNLTNEEADAYKAELKRLWEEHGARVAEKIEAFKTERLPQILEEEIKAWLRSRLNKKRIDSLEETIKQVSAKDLEEFKIKTTNTLLKEERQRLAMGDALVAMGHYRHVASRTKLRAADRIILDILDEEEDAQVVVFCEFKDVAQNLADSFGVPVLSGDTPQKQREKIVADFQNGENRVFVGIYGAGGVGITLTRAAHCILIGRPFTTGAAFQAEDRIHRISQQKTVIIQWLQIPVDVNDIDDKMDKMLQRKQGNISVMLDGATGDYDPNALEFSQKEALDLFYEATHFKAGRESEVGL